MSRTTYSEKLRDPKWQRRRLEMFTLADWKCQRCANPHEELHVHHTRYFKGREPWEYEDQWLRVLCAKCHAAEHPDKPTKPQAVKGSVFKRRSRVHYITLHEDLYDLCRGNPCAAMILDFLLREHDRLLKQHPITEERSEWSLAQPLSVAFLVDVLVWSYSKNSVSTAIQELEQLGFVSVIKKRPKHGAFDRRHYIKVNQESIQSALDSQVDGGNL